MKILVVDDDIDALQPLEMFLVSIGHIVSTALTPAEGIKVFNDFNPKLVFLDIHFPSDKRTGLDILQDIKKINKSIPVVIVTGFKDSENVLAAFRRGALDCLFKPYNFDYIRELLNNVETR